jgi:hypothetical protein
MAPGMSSGAGGVPQDAGIPANHLLLSNLELFTQEVAAL